MLLALIICQLTVLVAANPFHKYPFVFLLDVGNEELEKTNTEQIRISIPGGSVALRYPAIGDGKTISHLRVSGIDFGTDLKANIVDGGPGYKYVVLVFIGNAGVPYDTVVTVKTVDDLTFNTPNTGGVSVNGDDLNQTEEDANNSAEDLSDDSDVNNSQSKIYVQSSNAELMQSSSNVYNYAENEVMDREAAFDTEDGNFGNEDNDSGEELGVEEQNSEESDSSVDERVNESDEKDIHVQTSEDIDQIDDPSFQVKGVDDSDIDDDDDDDDDDEEISPELAQTPEENEPISVVDSGPYSKYESLKPHLNGGEVYYQDDAQKINGQDYQEPLDYEDPEGRDPIFNDGEDHDDVNKYQDSNNNNYIDSDDNYAVAY